MKNTQKIGVLGGSFNPIHIGHLILAQEVLERRELSKVLFVVNNIPPHKEHSQIIPPSHRFEMVKLAVADNPNFEPSDIEIKRQDTSYTFTTMNKLKQIYGNETELFFIIGADSIRELPTWYKINELVRLCRFITVSREGFSVADFGALRNIFNKNVIEQFADDFLQIPHISLSSTMIREKVKTGKSIHYLIPTSVEIYIRDNGLYRD